MMSALTSLSSLRTVFLTATTCRSETESRGHFRLLRAEDVFRDAEEGFFNIDQERN